MNKYTILNKENIENLKSRNNGFNGKVEKYLLQYSDRDKDKGWIKEIIRTEQITSTEDYEKMVSIKNYHLDNLTVKKAKKKKLTMNNIINLLKTSQGQKQLKIMGYNFSKI